MPFVEHCVKEQNQYFIFMSYIPVHLFDAQYVRQSRILKKATRQRLEREIDLCW